jgi:GNAT superfamily N-acetyltransferase
MLTTIPVRKAKPKDRGIILDICEKNHRENGQFSLAMPKVEAMVDKALTDKGAIIGTVGRDKIEGIIILLIAQFWYTEDWTLEEIMSYVLPEHRRSTHAKDLISFAKRCSDEIGIPLVSNERTKAKIELYRRQLGEPCGGYFLHLPSHPIVSRP